MPSILVMTALFGTSTVGANLLFEFQTGAHERMLVTPLSRPSLLIGRALKEMVPLAAQAVIIVVVMIPFGFELYPAGALDRASCCWRSSGSGSARSATRWPSPSASRSGCSGWCSRR